MKDPSVGPQAGRLAGAVGRRQRRVASRRNVVDISRGARAPNRRAPSRVAGTARRPRRRRRCAAWRASSASTSTRSRARARRPHFDRGREGACEAAGRRRAGAAAPRGASRCPTSRAGGPVERQPMRAVRRKTAEHLSAAWATIPHVTQCDLADITGARGAAQEVREAGGGRRRQSDGHRDRREGRRGGAEGVPAVQRVDRPGGRARSSSRSTSTSASPWTPIAGCWCR